ncbi:MAG: YciI family protein [Steroidobacteraceae bacterium]
MSSKYEKTAFVVICRDGPMGAWVRSTYTPEHLTYIETVMDELNVAGPLYDNGGAPVGSLYCLQTKSLERARHIIENDPYVRHGAFSSIEYFPHLPAAGRYIGGKVW